MEAHTAQGCSHPQHLRLSASPDGSARYGEEACITCFAAQMRTWSAHALFTHLCRLVALMSPTRAGSQPAVRLTEAHAEALAALTGQLFLRVCTPASLTAEEDGDAEERRLRTAFFHWLRVVLSASNSADRGGGDGDGQPQCRSVTASQSDLWLLGSERATCSSGCRLSSMAADAHSLGQCVTHALVREVCASITRSLASSSAAVKAAACVLCMTDLCADGDTLGPRLLAHLCADHLADVVPLLPIVAGSGGEDGALLELFLYWLHQVCTACQAWPESLERLASVMVAAPPSQMATGAVSPVAGLVACLVDWADRVPVVLNALSLLALCLDRATTAECLAQASAHDADVAPESGWDALVRGIVPLLLHRSEELAALAAEVMERVAEQGARLGAIALSLLAWAEDSALEATSAATSTTSMALLALLSTLTTSACDEDMGSAEGSEKHDRVLQAFYHLAELPSEVWVAAHSSTYFAHQLRAGRGGDAEAFATRCLRERARAAHRPPVAAGCFLCEVWWLCSRHGHATALSAEIRSALSQAVLDVFTADGRRDALCEAGPADFAWPCIEVPDLSTDAALLACAMDTVVWLTQPTSRGTPAACASLLGLGVWGLQQLLAGAAPPSCPRLAQSASLWWAAARLVRHVLRMVSPGEGLPPRSPVSMSAVHLTRELLRQGLLDALLAHAPGRGEFVEPALEGSAGWQRDVLAVLLGDAPLADVAALCPPGRSGACAWSELLACQPDVGGGGGETLLFGLAAWGGPATVVSEAQLLERLARHVRHWQSHRPSVCRSQVTQRASDSPDGSARLTGADERDHDGGGTGEWAVAVACTVMLLWVGERSFGHVPPPVPPAALPGESDGLVDHPALPPEEAVSALLEPATRDQLRPWLRWCAERLAMADASLPDLAQTLMGHEAWRPLGCALCLLCHLEQPEAPPSAVLPAANTDEAALQGLVAVALTHVQRVWRARQLPQAPPDSLHEAQRLCGLVQHLLTRARTAVAAEATADLGGSRALHCRVLARHVRPLLLTAPPPVAAHARRLPRATALEDALAALFVATLAGVGQREVRAIAALALHRLLPTLQRRLAEPAPDVASPSSLIVWLQLTYMLARGLGDCPGSGGGRGLLQAHALALTTPLSEAAEAALTQVRDTDSEAVLCASTVLALAVLVKAALHDALGLHASLPPPLWWTPLPVLAIQRALVREPAGASTSPPPVQQWRCQLLFLHVLSQLRVSAAPVEAPVSAQELAAVEVALDWTLAVLCAAGEGQDDAAERPNLGPVARLAGDLLRVYRRELAGSLHAPALRAVCRHRRSGLTAVAHGWILCGLVPAAPCHLWLRPSSPANREAVVRALLDEYNLTVSDWSRKRARHDDSEEARAVSDTLVRACERFFDASTTSAAPPSLSRIKDFLCPRRAQTLADGGLALPDPPIFYAVSGGVHVLLASTLVAGPLCGWT